MKVALVHDFLVKLGGAERVLKSLMEIYPAAPVFCLLYDEKAVGEVVPAERVRTSFLQKLPGFVRRRYPYLLPLIPRAVESLNFEGYDLVISSSTAYAHGIVVPATTKHVCYCHSPMRFAWDYAAEYGRERKMGVLTKVLFSYFLKGLREWDQVAADRPDLYLANSRNVQKRIAKYFRQESEVVYPPVEVGRFSAVKAHEDYFLIVSTLAAYKRVDLAVALFNRVGKRLIVIGDGPERAKLEAMAKENVEFLGFKSDEVVKEYLENCRAFVFPGEEDFGISAVEAMAAGKPVLAYGKGGLLESVVAGKTGEFFYQPTVEAMEDALGRLIANEKHYKAKHIREHAEGFSVEKFHASMHSHASKVSLS